MAFKTVSLCVLVVFVQQTFQCNGIPCYQYQPPCGCNSGVTITEIEEIEQISYRPIINKPIIKSPSCVSIDIPTSGGALVVTSIGGIAPTGIAVATELGLGGDLILSGELPYLTAVAFEGQFASADAVPVSYGCGDIVAITELIGGSAPTYNIPSPSSYSISTEQISLPATSYNLPCASPYNILPAPVKSCGCGCY